MIVRRYVLPSLFLLVGLFFILLPFVGSQDKNARHGGALNAISLVFGLLAAGISIWLMVTGYQRRPPPPT